MEELFIKLLNISITAGWMILAIILLRLIFRKAPKFVHCILWGMVAIRLVCPVSFESELSLVPSAQIITKNSVEANDNSGYNISTGITSVDSRVNEYLSESFYKDMFDNVSDTMVKNEDAAIGLESNENVSAGVEDKSDTEADVHTKGISIMNIASYIWLVGVVFLTVYSIVVYKGIYHKVAASIRLRDNIFICDSIDSPFILGIIKPRIYVPSTMNEKELNCVLAHEQAHIARFDYLWKPLGFMILSVYWFNPVIWMAYILLCRDIELACDERVIRQMNVEDKKEYSRTLLSCSVSHRMIAACPVAFGEVAVGRRVKSVLNYKKPAFWVMSLALAACVVVAVCFLTNPKTYAKEGQENAIMEESMKDNQENPIKPSQSANENGDVSDVDEKEIIYYYKHEYENVGLWIMLEPESKTYKMSKNFSIYDAVSAGMYELDENKLVLTDVLSVNEQYVFNVEGDELVFDAKNSSRSRCFIIHKDGFNVMPEGGGLDREELEDVYTEEEGFVIYEAIPDGARYTKFNDGDVSNAYETYEDVLEVFGAYDVCYDMDDNAKEKKVFNNVKEEMIFSCENEDNTRVYQVYLNTKYNTFKMKYEVYSYCAASGYYVIEGDKLILTDFNEPEKYVFKIVDGQLVFVEAESTEMPLYAVLADGRKYEWIGRKTDKLFDEVAYEKYSNDSDYEIIRFINDGDMFVDNLYTEEEYELQITYFRKSFNEGFVLWD